MNKNEFFDWMAGYFELANPTNIDENTTKLIKQNIDKIKNPNFSISGSYFSSNADWWTTPLGQTLSNSKLPNYC